MNQARQFFASIRSGCWLWIAVAIPAWFFLPSSAAAQTAMKIEAYVHRVPATMSVAESCQKEVVLLAFAKRQIGVITKQDTLLLDFIEDIPNPYGRSARSIDLIHGDAQYVFTAIEARNGITIMISPIFVERQRMYSIIISSFNL